MATETDEPEPRYRRAVWSRTYTDWRSTRDRLVWGVLVVAVGFSISGVGARMTPQQSPLLAGVIGALAAPVVVALVYLLYLRLRAPARIWADDRKLVAEVTMERDLLKAETATLRLEVDRLKEANGHLAEERERLQAQLDAKRQLELIPKKREESDDISFLSLWVERDDGSGLEVSLVWATVPVAIVNNDDHPTTIQRLWLRLCDPSTGEEILPLPKRDLGPPAVDGMEPPEEAFRPKELGARDEQEVELRFKQYYPRVVVNLARAGKAPSMVSLCAKAAGLDTVCCQLPEEFFAPSPMQSEGPEPSTASGQAPPSSPGSSGCSGASR